MTFLILLVIYLIIGIIYYESIETDAIAGMRHWAEKTNAREKYSEEEILQLMTLARNRVAVVMMVIWPIIMFRRFLTTMSR